MRTVVVIPARYNSTRFPGKPLVMIKKKTLIERVYEKCKKVVGHNNTYIASDDNRIFNFLKKKKINFIKTSKSCLTGTDRVAEAIKKIDADIIINVQGDEPMVSGSDIKKVINCKKKFKNSVICGFNKIQKFNLATNVNTPKVVMNENNDLIYISRSLVPGTKNSINKKKNDFYRQVCVYGFNRKQLLKFYNKKKKSKIEKIEDIEILRFFDLNEKIKMVKLSNRSIAIDTKEDLKKILKIIK